MCESSCAITPSTSCGSSRRQRPSVTATAECFGLRPVANAFGMSVGITATRGFGRSASAQSRSTIACSSGACSGSTTLAPEVASAILSEVKYWKSASPPTITTITRIERSRTWKRIDGEDHVEQAEQAAREEHPQGEARVASVRAPLHRLNGTGARSSHRARARPADETAERDVLRRVVHEHRDGDRRGHRERQRTRRPAGDEHDERDHRGRGDEPDADAVGRALPRQDEPVPEVAGKVGGAQVRRRAEHERERGHEDERAAGAARAVRRGRSETARTAKPASSTTAPPASAPKRLPATVTSAIAAATASPAVP